MTGVCLNSFIRLTWKVLQVMSSLSIWRNLISVNNAKQCCYLKSQKYLAFYYFVLITVTCYDCSALKNPESCNTTKLCAPQQVSNCEWMVVKLTYTCTSSIYHHQGFWVWLTPIARCNGEKKYIWYLTSSVTYRRTVVFSHPSTPPPLQKKNMKRNDWYYLTVRLMILESSQSHLDKIPGIFT